MKNLESPRHGGLETYLRELQKLPGIPAEEAAPLFDRAAAGDVAARERILLAHLPLVVRIAYKYGSYGLPLGDLVSEGNLGLIRAVELFDPKQGVDFSAYAGVWIKQRLHRAITAQAQVVRIPVWRSQRLRKLDRLREDVNAELGREAEMAELAERIGLSGDELAGIAADRVGVDSLDGSVETQQRMGRMIDDSVVSPDVSLSMTEIHEEIISALHELTDTELQILSRKFGLLNEAPESYRQMAPRLGRSREWIRQVGEAALAKVAVSLRKAGGLPRALIEKRREKARVRLATLARKRAVASGKLSLFQVVLTHWTEPLILIL